MGNWNYIIYYISSEQLVFRGIITGHIGNKRVECTPLKPSTEVQVGNNKINIS